MEKVQSFIRKYEDVISAAVQLLICFAAVLLALKNNKNIGNKQQAKLAKTEAKLRQKTMKTEAKLRQKEMKLSSSNKLKLQKERFRQKKYAINHKK